MGFQCAPQVLGLVPGATDKKHRAPASAICKECMPERASRSETLDRSRSHLNVYDTPFATGQELADAMQEDAESTRVKVRSNKDGSKKGRPTHERKMRSDAVIGYAVIFNPPTEVSEKWTEDEARRFHEDCWECLCQIEPRVFSNDNRMASCEHNDEDGRHWHDVGKPVDVDGRYCGNQISPRLYEKINAKFPAMMRECGWDVDDIDYTDRKRYATDPDYRAERKARKKTGGLSVNEYREKNTREKLAQAKDLLEEAERTKTQALEELKTAKDDRELARLELEDAQQQKVDGFTKGQKLGEKAAQEAAEDTIYKPARRKAAKIEADAHAEAKRLIEDAEAEAERKRAENVRFALNVLIMTLSQARCSSIAEALNKLKERANSDKQFGQALNTAYDDAYKFHDGLAQKQEQARKQKMAEHEAKFKAHADEIERERHRQFEQRDEREYGRWS